MSIDINWTALTSGLDGLALAERIRSFIDSKFQQVKLPRSIRSVKVNSFDFGSVAPEIVLKDICDPLPDFYEVDDDDDDTDEEGEEEEDSEGEGSKIEAGDGENEKFDTESEPVGPAASTSRNRQGRDLNDRSRAETGQRHLSPTKVLKQRQRQRERRRVERWARSDGAGYMSGGEGSPQPPMVNDRPSLSTNDIHRAGLSGTTASIPGLRNFGPGHGIGLSIPDQHLLSRSNTPGIPGGTSNLSYFHLPLGASLSGSQTPLAAVAGAQYPTGWSSASHLPNGQQTLQDRGRSPAYSPDNQRSSNPNHRHHSSISTTNSAPSPPSTVTDNTPIPQGHDTHDHHSPGPEEGKPAQLPRRPKPQFSLSTKGEDSKSPHSPPTRSSHSPSRSSPSPSSEHFNNSHHFRPTAIREPQPEDVQIVSRIKYAGDVKLSLTTEILLDYPMPSFVGIPLTLNITGLSFDGVAVVAQIRRRAHFCFLSPEDAATLLGADEDAPADAPAPGYAGNMPGSNPNLKHPLGSLLQDIKVESEIGQRDNGKQVLKNVGKVEKFVLEQVRRIFEDEFVYPSFWTFLI
ncbi:hypothetical protein L228DRAFT_247610 [Xylona heveae TC161]|uniref:Mitochondrial distribution and morphology protein 12 n=1 Tax=Xylona heveae (strain CBS 132557 / TC161) TaxID=1328760 RepID=A0A165GBV3_XYLHT|nr:hypothetical protein L228DRAFT_247610 [Xylona heveae TC161]KZF22000.1 hypothetical protein L228DRAFT_247610 [Xylona heveae TC161]